MGEAEAGGWVGLGSGDDGPRTTQRPAVLTIGPAGENLSRVACLIHDAANSAGQGGFGGIWGAKNLKAISVIGTGSVEIADPNALMQARLWAQEAYGLRVDHRFGDRKPQIVGYHSPAEGRLVACFGCHEGCRERNGTGLGNGSSCVETDFYAHFDRKKHGKTTEAAYVGTDLLQRYGVNAFEAWRGLEYISGLSRKGILGPGKQIECDLDFAQLGETEFAEQYVRMIATRERIGDDFAEGFVRAAERWGRLEEDLESGLLRYSYWGLPTHSYDPRAEVSWGYGSILGDRDINEHGLNQLFWWSSTPMWENKRPPIPAETLVKLFAEKLAPFEDDPRLLDYSTENIYSVHMARLVAWHRYYTRFWKQSALFCDLRWPRFISDATPDHRGIMGEGEPRFLSAVTGKEVSFGDGIELGKRIWNLDNAIWTLQGRHRDLVHFAAHIYERPYSGLDYPSYHLPGRRDGEWAYLRVNGRSLDRDKFEAFKTAYYEIEGWDTSSGWPTRETLEALDLGHVADELEGEGKLGG
jgi:aldehyde:ferredoxin oxidoreductase